MKKNLTVIFVLFSCFVNAQIYEWIEMTSLPHRLFSFASFSIDSSIYFVCGKTSHVPVTLSNEVWQYHINSNIWTQKNNFPGAARYGTQGFVIGNYAYVVCGWNASSMGLNDCWRYDPIADTWLQRANFPGSSRYTAATFALNGKGYVGCGYLPYTNDMYSYNPVTDSWSVCANFPGSARQCPTYFTIGNYAYCGLGVNSTGGNLRAFYKYNPVADSWSPLNDFPDKGRYETYQFVFDTVAFVGMGLEYDSITSSASPSNKLWKYQSSTDTWSTSVLFPDSAIFDGGFVSNNGYGYAGGGAKDLDFSLNPFTNTFWRFGINSTVGINSSIDNKKEIVIFPNPNSGSFQIYYSQLQNKNGIFILLDILGNKVFEIKLDALDSVSKIHLSELSDGIYFYKIYGSSKEIIANGKMIIAK